MKKPLEFESLLDEIQNHGDENQTSLQSNQVLQAFEREMHFLFNL